MIPVVAIETDVTYQVATFGRIKEQSTIAKVGTDIGAPSYNSGTNIVRLVGSHPERNRLMAVARFSPWLSNVLSTISSYRAVSAGWDGFDAIAPPQGSLDSAEMLATYLSNAKVRPMFSVDAHGRPTFSWTDNDFYVHLTVDQPERLTLFAEIDGAEHFDDEIDFNGRRLPAQLSVLF